MVLVLGLVKDHTRVKCLVYNNESMHSGGFNGFSFMKEYDCYR